MDCELIEVTIAAKRRLAERIAGLELVRSNGEDLPPFTAGSHVDLHLSGKLVRQYSLCNCPSETHRYCIGVLREEDGRGGSEAVHNLQEGARLKISPPRNSFALQRDATHSFLLAGGIGITPILSMARALHARNESFELHYCARSPDRMAFRSVLESTGLAEKAHLHFDDGPEEQKFDLASLGNAPKPGTHLYVCGPTGFMDAVTASVKAAWPASAVHQEFFTAETEAGEGENRAFDIKLNSTGEIFRIPADRTIVQVLADAGVDVPTSCEQGICGTCLTPVLQGTPEHRDLVLTDEEHAENDQMTLCCSRASSDLLVLDL